MEYEIDDITLKADHATSMALLVNEVVTNSLKYAFPDGWEGRLGVHLRNSTDGHVILTVADDGVGFDPYTARKGMGSRLIRGVISQFRGTYEYEASSGTRFSSRLDLK